MVSMTMEEKAKFYDDIMATTRCHELFYFDDERDEEFSAVLFVDDGFPSESLAGILLSVIEAEVGKKNFHQFVSDRLW